MSTPLARFTPLAETDLQEILDYIAADNPTAGLALVARIREACELLAQFPMSGRSRTDFKDQRMRSHAVGNYVIFYRPGQDGVEIARIFHGARDYESLL